MILKTACFAKRVAVVCAAAVLSLAAYAEDMSFDASGGTKNTGNFWVGAGTVSFDRDSVPDWITALRITKTPLAGGSGTTSSLIGTGTWSTSGQAVMFTIKATAAENSTGSERTWTLELIYTDDSTVAYELNITQSATSSGGGGGGSGDDSEQYTVTLDATGGTVSTSTLEVASGDAVGSLPSPTREDYAFTGWYTAETGGIKVRTTTVVTRDVTYYAHGT